MNWECRADFSKHEEHGLTVQYRANVAGSLFRFYVPRAMFPLELNGQTPSALTIQFTGQDPFGFNKMGSARIEPMHWEFDIDQEMVNVMKYVVWVGGQKYDLHLPKVLLGSQPAPKRIAVEMIPDGVR